MALLFGWRNYILYRLNIENVIHLEDEVKRLWADFQHSLHNS